MLFYLHCCGPAFFTCVPTRSARFTFYFWKINFGKSWSRHLFYFYFKGEIKQERKTLKCDSIIFGKSMYLKKPSLGLGIRLPIGKVPLKGMSHHLFYFYFKGKIKQERKTLKCDSIIFGKSMYLKNPSLGLGIRLPIGKVPLKGSTLSSLIKVSTD